METNLDDFYNQLKETHQESALDIESSFDELKQYVSTLDPVKLLSQLTLTYLYVPEDKFIEEGDKTIKWYRWIEFLAGYLVSKEYPNNPEKNIDGRNLERIMNLLDKYFHSIETHQIISTSAKEKKDFDIERIIASAKSFSLFVRGYTYTHKLLKLVEDIYSPHDKWFKTILGFTIKEAIELSKSIEREYDERVNEWREKVKVYVKKEVNDLVKNGKASEKDRKGLETKLSVYLYFSNSDKLLSFTLDELHSFSGLTKETCTKFLKRLSQSFGYRNPEFTNTFQNPFAAPWDYNTLYERPIIFYENKYFAPILFLFPTVLFDTFNYDLISDSTYSQTYNKKRGAWLEERTANCFKKIFHQNEVLLNPKYPNGDELADVLILHDRKIFIVQCKSKKLRYESKIGENIETLKEDLEKGIKDAFEQAAKARDYLNSNAQPQIITSNRKPIIDRKQVTDIFLVSVTLSHYQNLTTRLANINSTLNLFGDKEYPWAISLFDLEVITELIDYPSMFIHYAKRRLQIEQTNFDLSADEIDLLGYYFSQGLYFETDEYKQLTHLVLSGLSLDIDKYMFEKYELGKNVEKPKQKMPEGFEEYISEIERLEFPYKTDCAMRLLNLSYKDRELFVNDVGKTKEKTKSDGRLHNFSVVFKNNSFGLFFISVNAEGDIEKLFEQVRNFAIMKINTTQCRNWVGFGWDMGSKKKIDVAFFVPYEMG